MFPCIILITHVIDTGSFYSIFDQEKLLVNSFLLIGEKDYTLSWLDFRSGDCCEIGRRAMQWESENLNHCIGSQAKNRKPRLNVNSAPQHLHHRLLSRLSGHQFCMSFHIRGILEVGKPWQQEGELAIFPSSLSLPTLYVGLTSHSP